MFPKTATNLRFAGIFFSTCVAVGLTLACFQKAYAPKTISDRPADDLTPLRLTVAKHMGGEIAINELQNISGQILIFDCILTNITDHTIKFSKWNCGYYANWQISNPKNVEIYNVNIYDNSVCNRTVNEGFTLPPKQSIIFQIPIQNPMYHSEKFKISFHPSATLKSVYDSNSKFLRFEIENSWKHDPLNQDFVSNEIEF